MFVFFLLQKYAFYFYFLSILLAYYLPSKYSTSVREVVLRLSSPLSVITFDEGAVNMKMKMYFNENFKNILSSSF